MGDFMDTLIEKAKNEILIINDKIKKNGGEYNIFNVLGIERDEVFTHSNIIYSFLNQDSGHFMGQLYLELFIEHVLGIKDPLNLSTQWCVEREWPFPDGRIDFIIHNNNIFIAIEMKIDAKDQNNQLVRYERYAKSINQNYKVFYLTLHGNEATYNSIQGMQSTYDRISFKDHILNWLNLCISNTPKDNKILNVLQQYKDLVIKLGSNQNKEGIKEMVQLINNPENYRAYLKLKDSETLMKQEFIEKFLNKIQEKLNQIDLNFRRISSDNNKSLAKSFINDSKVRIGYQLDTKKHINLSNCKEYTLVLAIDIGEPVGDMVIGYCLKEPQGNIDSTSNVNINDLSLSEEDKEKLSIILDLNKKEYNACFESIWIYWKYVSSENIKKYELRKFNDSVIDMLDSNKFENEMNRIQGIIKEHLRKVDKLIP